MLHVLHQIERRFGSGSAPARLVGGILLTLFALLLVGIALLWSRDARALAAHAPAAASAQLSCRRDAGHHVDGKRHARARKDGERAIFKQYDKQRAAAGIAGKGLGAPVGYAPGDLAPWIEER